MTGYKNTPPVASSGRGWKHYLSLGVAVLACPCHLPLLVVALGGTALGGWLSQYTVVVALAMVGIFVLALLYGIGTFNRQRGGAGTRARREAEGHSIEEEAWSGR